MEYFKKIPIEEGLTEIDDLCGTKMYLVEGTGKALLIDTGVGLGNIGAFVKTLTRKPLTVVITHGHVDHAMGSGTFDEDVPIYLSGLDYDTYKKHAELNVRQGYYDSVKWIFAGVKNLLKKTDSLDWVVPAETSRFHDLKPGMTFDLGGETVEICPGAGHTPGCITVLMLKKRILLTGDACNQGTYLFDDYSIPVSGFKKAMEELKAQTDGRYDRLLVCHGRPNAAGFDDVRMVDGAIALSGMILAGTDKHIAGKQMGKEVYRAKKMFSKDDIGDHSLCNIIYSDYTLK